MALRWSERAPSARRPMLVDAATHGENQALLYWNQSFAYSIAPDYDGLVWKAWPRPHLCLATFLVVFAVQQDCFAKWFVVVTGECSRSRTSRNLWVCPEKRQLAPDSATIVLNSIFEFCGCSHFHTDTASSNTTNQECWMTAGRNWRGCRCWARYSLVQRLRVRFRQKTVRWSRSRWLPVSLVSLGIGTWTKIISIKKKATYLLLTFFQITVSLGFSLSIKLFNYSPDCECYCYACDD